MEKKDLLKFCRFYKKEAENPYKEGDKALLWEYEQKWVENTLKKDVDSLGGMLDDYSRAGLSQFNNEDDTPATLKALLFNRFCYWRSGTMIECVGPFKEWYRKYYN